jgi:hypothetical protein
MIKFITFKSENIHNSIKKNDIQMTVIIEKAASS